MARLTRAQIQELNRAKVLAAARDEFLERGYRDAKVDAIAERADLTRGAVYSNFSGKRALYFGVLADLAESTPALPAGEPGLTAGEALGILARVWLARLPLATDEPLGSSRLGIDLITEVISDERIRTAYAQLMGLDAILLGLALERMQPGRGRRRRLVPVAEMALTLLHGAGQMAAAAPGFSDPFNVIVACENVAGLNLDGGWMDIPFITEPTGVDRQWSPPAAVDLVTAEPADLSGDQVLAFLGMNRLSAVEEAVRAGNDGLRVTCVAVAGDPPDDLRPLARLAVIDVCNCIRQAFPRRAWPPLQVVPETGDLAAAAGVAGAGNDTEVAIRINGGRVVAVAEGRGACHVIASMKQ